MKVYQDLTIRGSRRALEEFVVELEKRLKDGWSRQRTREAEVNRLASDSMYCFACTAKDARPASELWIATHSDGTLYVSNIWAQEFSSLSFDQYNAILSDFNATCVEPAARAIGVEVKLGNPDPQIEDFLSPKTVLMLRHFSQSANRSILHFYDDKRWHEFVASAYREGAALDPDMLKRWLIEEEKWSESSAASLANKYNDELALLKVYESQPA